jgi:hypothetical protein
MSSELPDLLSTKPVPSELVYLLVKLDKDYGNEKTTRSAPFS